jgi:hypothetical protein
MTWEGGGRSFHSDAVQKARTEILLPGAKQCCEAGPLGAELLVPYPAAPMTAWRVSDDAKNSRIEPHAGMAEPVPD